MEQVVGAQERALLATVGGRLEPRFDRLRGAHRRGVRRAHPARAVAGPIPPGDAQSVARRTRSPPATRRRPARSLPQVVNRSPMNQFLRHAAALAGLAVIAWVGAGYLLTNPLALAITALIGAFYLMGVLELHRFRQASDELALAVAELAEPLPSLRPWLERVPAGLRNAVRRRVEGEPVGLPGPSLAPTLAGLLVLLGMLGHLPGHDPDACAAPAPRWRPPPTSSPCATR
jgi:hypothetical protein